jgi:hypothetical protein
MMRFADQGLGAPVASIGGAGTFDGIFLTAILAVLIAGLSPSRRGLKGCARDPDVPAADKWQAFIKASNHWQDRPRPS